MKDAEEGDRVEKLKKLLKNKIIHFRSKGSTRSTSVSVSGPNLAFVFRVIPIL